MIGRHTPPVIALKQCFAAITALLLSFVSASMDAAEPGFATLPTPAELARFRNWTDSRDNGSCAWASLCMICIHAGNEMAADTIRRLYAGGAIFLDAERAIARMNLPLRVVRSRHGFLELELALKRGEWVTMTWQVGNGTTWCNRCKKYHGGEHMLNAVGISADGSRWAILDNRFPDRVRIISRDTAWREYNAGGAWGVVEEATR